MPTTCIAISLLILNKLQVKGTNKSDPPTTPEAPQAHTLVKIIKITAVKKSTFIPSVLVAAKVKIAMVIAAPAVLIAAPNGIDTE